MKNHARVLIALSFILMPLFGMARISYQVTAINLSPGESRIVHCDTGITVMPVNPQEIQVDCPPLDNTPTRTPTRTSTPVAPTSTRTPTSLPPTSTPTAVLPTVPPSTGNDMWISPAELASLPMSGAAWNQISAVANGSIGTANLSDQDSDHDVNTLAVALVAMRTGNASLRAKAANAIMSAIETENGGRTLALGRNLVGYVIAADVIDLQSYDPTANAQFRSWLSGVRTEVLDGNTLIETQERRPNNWGTMASASLIAADIYLGDTAGLNGAAQVFHGWLGDRSSYAGFDYGDLSWQCNTSLPVGINSTGCTKSGHNVDGVLPDDQRRTGSFSWPPPCGNYPHGALQGSVVAAELLRRAGYDAWNWENQALRRAYVWLYSSGDGKSSCPASGDDAGYPILVNHIYGTSFSGSLTASPGKNMGWLGWTHS